MYEPCFIELFKQDLLSELHLIHKIGNQAAHSKRISEQDALPSLKYLFRLPRFLAIYYGKKTLKEQLFDEALIPRPQAKQVARKDLNKCIKKLQDKPYMTAYLQASFFYK